LNGPARRRLLVLGGVDPCGGAGITADTLVAALHGVEALPIALALTVQNRHGFTASEDVAPNVWRAALAAALADGDVHAVKTGLLGSAAAVREVAAALRPLRGRVPIVVDPVLSATAGGYDAGRAVAAAFVTDLLPLATLVTPNTNELAALSDVGGRDGSAGAGGAVLKKGGHDEGEFAVDVLRRAGAPDVRFARRRLPVGPVHGTGCALATSIACGLADGLDLAVAVARAGDWLWAKLAALGPAPAEALPRTLPFAGASPITRTSPR